MLGISAAPLRATGSVWTNISAYYVTALVLLIAPFPAIADTLGPPGASSGLPSNDILQTDSRLQQITSVIAVREPIGDVLARVSRTLNAEILAADNVRDQRVTIYVESRTAGTIMRRICQLLSHDLKSGRGYRWRKIEGHNGTEPAYRLVRDEYSFRKEHETLDYPRIAAGKLVREARDLARMSDEDAKKHVGMLPGTYMQGNDAVSKAYHDALAGLTKSDCADLANGMRVPLSGNPDLTGIYLKCDDDNGALPEKSHVFGLYFDGPGTNSGGMKIPSPEGQTSSVHIAFDTFRPSFMVDPLDANFPHGGEALDLTEFNADKSLTEEQHRNIDFILINLAKLAHIDLYRESFVELPRFAQLSLRKGSLDEMARRICVEFECTFKKADDAYFVCDRTWALKKQADISDSELARWRQMSQPADYSVKDTFCSVASALSWPQISQTLTVALPGCYRFSGYNGYRAWRLYATLTPSDYKVACSGSGLALAATDPTVQTKIKDLFGTELGRLMPNQVADVILSEKEMIFGGRQHIEYTLSAGGTKFSQGGLNYDLPKESPNPGAISK